LSPRRLEKATVCSTIKSNKTGNKQLILIFSQALSMASKQEASSKLAAALAARDWSGAKKWVKDSIQVSRTEALDKLLLVVGRMSADAESTDGPTTHAQWRKQRKNADGTPRAIPVDDPHWDELKAICALAADLLAINGEKMVGRDAFAFLMAPDYVGEKHNHSKPHSETRARASQWIAEAGGLWQVKDWELTAGKWDGVPESVCQDLARAYARHNGLRGNTGFSWSMQFIRCGKFIAGLDLLEQEIAVGRLVLSEKSADLSFPQSMIAHSARAASADPKLKNMKPDSWRKALEEAEQMGLRVGANTLAAIVDTVLPSRPLGFPPAQATPEILAQLKRDLDWAFARFTATPEDLSALLDTAIRGSKGDRSAPETFGLWLLAHGAAPSAQGWAWATEESPSMLKLFVEKNLPWQDPVGTLAAAAATREGKSDSLSYLMGLRPWSADERARAAANALKWLPATSKNINALMRQGPYTPQELAHGLLAACDGSGANGRQGIQWASAADWLKAGADPKGPKSDGEPLRRALGKNNWDGAKTVADADGWGPVAEAWLLTPRKKDPPQLRPWIEEACAIRDARALRKTLSTVKTMHAKEDQKAFKAKVRAQKKTESGTAEADAPPVFAATKELAKRSGRRL